MSQAYTTLFSSLTSPPVHLSEGLKRERDDAFGLVYAPISDELVSEDDEYEELDGDEDVESTNVDVDHPKEAPLTNGKHTTPEPESLARERLPSRTRPTSPPLPLSPISNPSTPPRKRQRTSDWHPPAHIPDFLPAFPSESKARQEPASPASPRPPPSQPPPLKIERPSSPLLQPSTPTYASDYFTSVPYSQSSLSSMSEWHLPSRPPRAPQQPLARLPTPQTQPALLAAYHHILTHPPPANATSANPSRHKVAMALLSLTQNNPRWETPDTLYSSSAPCTPRITSIGPTYPIPLGENPHDQKTAADAERDRKINLPPLPPRPVFGNERITSLITQQPSRIPDLARHVLPVSRL